jgi:hypothetical protein
MRESTRGAAQAPGGRHPMGLAIPRILATL